MGFEKIDVLLGRLKKINEASKSKIASESATDKENDALADKIIALTLSNWHGAMHVVHQLKDQLSKKEYNWKRVEHRVLDAANAFTDGAAYQHAKSVLRYLMDVAELGGDIPASVRDWHSIGALVREIVQESSDLLGHTNAEDAVAVEHALDKISGAVLRASEFLGDPNKYSKHGPRSEFGA